MSLWVKICGVTSAADVEVAARAGADAVGVNLFEGSPRYCTPEAARRIVAAAPPTITVFGVFVDTDRDSIQATIDGTGIGGIQLHGAEAADIAVGWGLPVIRAVAVRSREQVEHQLEAARTNAGAYRILFDNPAGGGSGQRWSEESVVGLDLSSAIIAGGLDPANVGAVAVRLQPWGVDTASGVETAPGQKDERLVVEFVKNARSA